MYSNNNKSLMKVAALVAVLSVCLASCASPTKQSVETNAGKNTQKSSQKENMVGAHLCFPANKRIPMSKKIVGPFIAFYPQKFIVSTLKIAQMTCDLGTPHEIKTAAIKSEEHGMPMQAGDQLLRWGDNQTNNPIDEISFMVVAGKNGEVSSVVTYDTKAKTLKRVSKFGDKINVATGTYTANRTAVSQ